MKVTFNTTVQFQTDGRNKGPVYEAGKTYDLRDDHANRWIRRGMAAPAKDSASVAAHPASVDLDKQKGGKATRLPKAAA